MMLVPKNWNAFQHYKDRRPPWIKLHREILDDRKFMCLPIASKALAPLLWLLASESDDGSFDASTEELSFRLRISEKEIDEGLKSLIDNGFFLDASTMLAPCYQVARPEERRIEVEKSRAKDVSQNSFDEFWSAYPKKIGKGAAQASWKKKKPNLQIVLDALAWQTKTDQWTRDKGQYIPNPSTWLNQERWMDENPDEKPFDLRQWELEVLGLI